MFDLVDRAAVEAADPGRMLEAVAGLLVDVRLGYEAGLAAENLLQALSGRVPKEAVNKDIARHWRAAYRRRLLT